MKLFPSSFTYPNTYSIVCLSKWVRSPASIAFLQKYRIKPQCSRTLATDERCSPKSKKTLSRTEHLFSSLFEESEDSLSPGSLFYLFLSPAASVLFKLVPEYLGACPSTSIHFHRQKNQLSEEWIFPYCCQTQRQFEFLLLPLPEFLQQMKEPDLYKFIKYTQIWCPLKPINSCCTFSSFRFKRIPI